MNLVLKDLMESTKKSLKEATNTGYTLEDLERLFKIDETIDYELGIIAQPKDEEVPFAWDAGVSIVEGQVHIDGNFMPGGPEAGRVHIECKFDSFKRNFELRCDLYALDDKDLSDEDKDFVRTMCTSY